AVEIVEERFADEGQRAALWVEWQRLRGCCWPGEISHRDRNGGAVGANDIPESQETILERD
ncbi:MAG: hypothetical protein QOE34_1142, partial [Verrucomicrobiota bacterium]